MDSCELGLNEKQCGQFSDLFAMVALPRVSCDECDLAQRIEIFSLSKEILTHQQLVEAEATLTEFGILNKEPVPSFKFYCPQIKERMSKSCQLQTCSYWVDCAWAYNCLWAYLKHQGSEKLSAEEVSYLYNLPIDDVQHALYEGMQKLRTGSLQVASEQNELPRVFDFIKTHEVCCVCEEPIENRIQTLHIVELDMAYCSRECKKHKPPRLIELENQYGAKIGDILKWAMGKFHSLSTVEQALSIHRWMLYEACERFIGKDPEEYFPALRAMKKHRRTSLVRRTWHAPKWVDEMIAKMQPVVRQIEAKNGKPTVPFDDIREQLKDALANL
jgi:hypothetical protein